MGISQRLFLFTPNCVFISNCCCQLESKLWVTDWIINASWGDVRISELMLEDVQPANMKLKCNIARPVTCFPKTSCENDKRRRYCLYWRPVSAVSRYPRYQQRERRHPLFCFWKSQQWVKSFMNYHISVPSECFFKLMLIHFRCDSIKADFHWSTCGASPLHWDKKYNFHCLRGVCSPIPALSTAMLYTGVLFPIRLCVYFFFFGQKLGDRKTGPGFKINPSVVLYKNFL